jgi:hypothetical protein
MHDLSAQAQAAPMSLGDKLTIAGIVIAVIAIAVGIWAARRYGNRPGVVLFTYASTQLIPDLPFSAKDLLKVEYRDLPVHDPHLLSLRFQNVGSRDIASSNFDAGRPVTIKTNCQFYGFVTVSHPNQTVGRAIGSDGEIDIMPTLLKRAEVLEISAIISGAPKVEIDAPLIDVNVLDRKTFDAKVARNIFVSIMRASAAVVGGGIVLTVADEFVSRSRSGDY